MLDPSRVRDFLFRGLMFESEADAFRRAGIRVGEDARSLERDLLDETLSPFDITLRNQALRMMRLYAQLYCFENSIRDLVIGKLQENHGDDWWNSRVPKSVQKQADSRRAQDLKESWLDGDRGGALAFVDFGGLADIITHNWEDFSELFPTQHWLKQRLDEIEKARNFVAHNRLLQPSEFARLEMYVDDWNRVVGL